jgi:hypothetical protein
VQQHSRDDGEWDEVPGRRQPDEGIRHRLRALFAPTDDEEAIGALISERGREIEEQTARLQATIAGLERREEAAARLRSAVERMLRQGSAELDERQAALAALAADLGARGERLREQERDVALRKQELGAVELRRAAVERREESAAERESALESAASQLRERELELRTAEEELAAARRQLQAVPAAEEQEAPEVPAHLLYLPGDGYRLIECDGPAPAAGSSVEVAETRFEVTRVGRSLLPGDRRACAYLELARDLAPD